MGTDLKAFRADTPREKLADALFKDTFSAPSFKRFMRIGVFNAHKYNGVLYMYYAANVCDNSPLDYNKVILRCFALVGNEKIPVTYSFGMKIFAASLFGVDGD